MDILKKREAIVENKRRVASLSNEAALYYIVYFLNSSEDIIYIGRKKGSIREVEEYVLENAHQRMADYFYFEALSSEENPDDAHAEAVLEFQPYGNQQVPRNNKFISATKAKEDYRIDLRQFKKFFKEAGGYLFNEKMYVVKNSLLHTFGISAPYSKEMPRVGYYVIENTNKNWEQIKGALGFYRVLHEGWQHIEQTQENGVSTTIIKEKWPTIDERISRMEELLSDSYKVDSILNSEVFTAVHTATQKKKTFTIHDYGSTWVNGPSPHERDDMYYRLHESKKND